MSDPPPPAAVGGAPMRLPGPGASRAQRFGFMGFPPACRFWKPLLWGRAPLDYSQKVGSLILVPLWRN